MTKEERYTLHQNGNCQTVIDEKENTPLIMIENVSKSLENISKSNKIFNKGLAKIFLSIPIPINYELWCFLHEIADGDVK